MVAQEIKQLEKKEIKRNSLTQGRTMLGQERRQGTVSWESRCLMEPSRIIFLLRSVDA